MDTRVAVTGLGVVCAAGSSTTQYGEALRAGRGGIVGVRSLDLSGYSTQVGGEVQGPTHERYLEKLALDRRDTTLVLAAAQEAISSSGLKLERVPSERVGIVLGTLLAGLRNGEIFQHLWLSRGLAAASKRFLLYQMPHTPADALSASFHLKGPKTTISTACASGGNAIGYGMDLIRDGIADVVLAGGVDPFARFCFAGFNCLGALSQGPCAPFSTPMGISIGEGAAILVLESLSAAVSRGATIVAELLGYGLSADAYHGTAPDPAGKGMVRAMASALAAAGVTPDAVGYINAHGTGTGENCAIESKAIKLLLGDRATAVPVSSTKSMIGHTMGAAGALEAVATVLAIRDDFVPPTINFRERRPNCDLDYVPNQSRPLRVDIAISNSFGFGGANAAVVIGRYKPARAVQRNGAGERRVGVTGIGVASCIGSDLVSFGEAVRTGHSGIAEIRSFDWRPYGLSQGGEVDDSALHANITVDRTHLRRMDKLSTYSVACAQMALNDARLRPTPSNSARIGVFFGTGTGPVDTVATFNRDLAMGTPSEAQPVLFANTVFNAAAGHVCQEFGLKGPTSTLVNGDTSFIGAASYASGFIKRGLIDTAVVVCADIFCETLFGAFSKLKLMSPEACRPFDRHRTGLTLSGGAAAFVLEHVDQARARSAPVYGELLGYGVTSDGYKCGACEPSGKDWSRAIKMALGEEDPTSLGFVASAASGLPGLDLTESRAIRLGIGSAADDVPVTAIRSIFGYAGSSGPGLSFAAGLLAMKSGFVPPTAHLDEPDPECALRTLLSHPTEKKINRFLLNSFAWGGGYAALLCAKTDA